MVQVNRYIQKFPKLDRLTSSQKVYEKLLNEKYSVMTFEEVIDEMRYLTLNNQQGLSGQMYNLRKSYHDKLIGRFLRRHDNVKFKAMYREWKSQLPLTPHPKSSWFRIFLQMV